jgi:hypothetical protein
MPFKFVRSTIVHSLIKETKERVLEEISGMSDEELKNHLDDAKSLHESLKEEGDDDSKILHHEVKIIRAEYIKRTNKKNAKLARQFEKLRLSKQSINCPHCGKSIQQVVKI